MILPIWLLSAIPSFEAGVWSTLAARRWVNPDKTRSALVWGSRRAGSTHIPFIDERMRKQAGPATKLQSTVCNTIVKLGRAIVNAPTFEHATLIAVKRWWPKGAAISEEVKLCL